MRRRLLAALLLAAAAPLAAQERPTASLRAATPVPDAPITLLDAIRLGRNRSLQVAGAEAQARQARARADQRRADLLPQVSGSASLARQSLNLDEFGIPVATGVTPGFEIYRFVLVARQTVFDPALLPKLRAARDQAAAAGDDARAVGELGGATAGLAYLRVLSAQETVAAREADSTVADTLLAQARALVRSGVSPSIDATRSEVSFQSVRTQLAVARLQRDRARLDLLRALDLPSTAPLQLSGALDDPGPSLPTSIDSAVTLALAQRADLRAARARLEAAERLRTSIRAENLPSVTAAGQLNETGRSLGTLAFTYSAQLGIAIPIFDGLRRQARADEQLAVIESEQLRTTDVARQVETEARQAYLDLASAEQQVAIAGERVRLAERELAEAQERFRAGVAGSVETTNAQGSLLGARDAFIQARVSRASARVGAWRALGLIEQLP